MAVGGLVVNSDSVGVVALVSSDGGNNGDQ